MSIARGILSGFLKEGLEQKAARDQISNVIVNEESRYCSAIAKLISRKKYWTENPKYSFQFEKVKPVGLQRRSYYTRVKDWWFKTLMSGLGVLN